MNRIDQYPQRCRKSICRVMDMLCTDAQTAYAMILLTAALSDLDPSDDKVIEYIMDDCKVEVER